MLRNRSFILLATLFIVWLCVFSTYGNADSSYDDKVYTQSALADPRDIPGFPISIGGGGNNNGGGGWLRIWTPFGWITIGGGGNNHGGGGGGRFLPFLPPPMPLKPKLPPFHPPPIPLKPKFPPFHPPPIPLKPHLPPFHPPSPLKPNLPPLSPLKPVTPNPPTPCNPTPEHPVKPTPQNPFPVTPKPSNPAPQHPSYPVMPNPFKPTPYTPTNPPHKIPPWLAPFFGGGGKKPSPPPHNIPSWLAPYINRPPPASKPAHLTVNSMGTQSKASAVETSKTYAEERHHYKKCWSALEKIDKCVNQILTAFSSRKFQVLGSACCSAIEKMDKDCHSRTIGNFHDHFFSASVHRQCSAN